MNYGKYEAERRLKSLHSKSGNTLHGCSLIYLRRFLSCFYFWQ